MFQPAVFRETRSEVMHDHMRQQPFATIVSSATGSLSANHVPVVLKQGPGLGVLHGHIASVNPLFRETDGTIDVLAIFQGPQTYITPSWYSSKKEHGKVVPTWN
ncbi:MAG: FMN-binding negative transcriptional regulator, partial [Pseudomonadota bacterium]